MSYPGRNSAPRITPASAGKRQARSCGSREPRDHPCGYREKIRPRSISSRNTGSPPRVRGKDRLCRQRVRGGRITHAGAGKRVACPDVQYVKRDHPRGYGEKSGIKEQKTMKLGSPTRIRGKGPPAAITLTLWRITHADTGKRLKNRDGRPFLEIESFNFV